MPFEKWPYPRAFVARFGTYLFSHQLSKGIKEVLETLSTIGKIVHIVGDKKISMFELAKRCPDSQNVGEITLEEYYRNDPNACKLTKDMSLRSSFWKTYSIDDDLPVIPDGAGHQHAHR